MPRSKKRKAAEAKRRHTQEIKPTKRLKELGRDMKQLNKLEHRLKTQNKENN